MANVDLTTRKIRGAKKGTLKYFHEEGHLVFEEKFSIGNRIRVIQDLSFKSLVFVISFAILLPINFFRILIILLILINIISELYEEKWCWNYAKKLIKGGKKGDDEGGKKGDDEGIKTTKL